MRCTDEAGTAYDADADRDEDEDEDEEVGVCTDLDVVRG